MCYIKRKNLAINTFIIFLCYICGMYDEKIVVMSQKALVC